MSFISTYSSLSERGWQSAEGSQQFYSQIATQFGPPNNRASFGEFVGISDYTIGNLNLSVSGGSASQSFPNGFVRGSFCTTAFETFGGIREIFTGSNGSTSFGTHCTISADGKYIATSGNGNIGTAGNLNIYSSDANYFFSSQYVNPPTTGSYRNQGIAINADGTSVAIGAGGVNRIDVYGRSGNTWSLSTSLTPNVGNVPQAGFGSEMSYSDNNTLVVGAPGTVGVLGTAFIYANNTQVARIFPSVSSADDAFGTDVAISSDANYLVVGSRNTATTGKAFVYANVANTWTEIAVLSPPANLTPNIQFGGCVAISNNGNTVIVGGSYAVNPSTGFTKGFVSTYSKNGNSYIESQTLFSPVNPPITRDNFGVDIGLTRDGRRLIVSEMTANTGGQQTGAVYLYQSLY
jgi:hypothetical protein